MSRDNGWASLSAVGSYMAKNNPSFDTRLYGFRKLSDLVRKQAFIEIKESTDGSGGAMLTLRLKPGAQPVASQSASQAAAPPAAQKRRRKRT